MKMKTTQKQSYPQMNKILNCTKIRINNHIHSLRLLIAVILVMTSHSANANMHASPFEFHFNATGIYQNPYEKGIDDDTNISADLYGRYYGSGYTLNAHIEANSTPREKGMASAISQSNADARTALSSNNKGRLQISEFFLSTGLTNSTVFHIGLLDSTAFFDSSNISNNENTQFIASDFVNNPVIDFPDYSLAGIIEHRFSNTNITKLMISSTNGLADNPSRDYSSLFEINDDKKGIFSILESKWQSGREFFEVGVWSHNGAHQALDNATQTNLKNYGAYLTAGTGFGAQSFELRSGYANEKVSTATGFASIAYELSMRRWVFGTAYGYTKISKYITGRKHSVQEVEVYGRRMIGRKFSITPSIQYFKNPLHDTNIVPNISDEIWAANVRFNIEF
ncbi:hypothetical protein [Hydrogenovibrio kuenenii]|uniref:hypothetical protein n=1 Tax=Hydrogenovibrio kuenenii TaxID=63658 RepID=UPI0004640405|nr:hypothetical protein [Hydrogenovibrio kuenenii]